MTHLPAFPGVLLRRPRSHEPGKHIQAHSSIFKHIQAYSSIFRHLQAYSSIFKHIQAYAWRWNPVLGGAQAWTCVHARGDASALDVLACARPSTGFQRLWRYYMLILVVVGPSFFRNFPPPLPSLPVNVLSWEFTSKHPGFPEAWYTQSLSQ